MSRLPPDTTRAVLSVKVERSLDAPPAVVWKAILDFPSYHIWNSVVRNMTITDSMSRPLLADPRPTEGAHVLLRVRMPPRGLDDDDKRLRRIKGVITYIDDANHRVVWEQVGYPHWLLRTERWQEVTEEQVDGKTVTKYMTVETFNGPAAWIVRFFMSKTLATSFHAMADGLKKYAEGSARAI